jgi:hypothetical protein
MPVTPARACALALSLEGVAEAPHFDRTAFRRARIFATLAGDGADINLMFDRDHQEHWVERAPEVFAALDNAWGRAGATRCDLAKVDEATLRDALVAAHALAAPKPKKPRAKRK